MEKDDYPPIDYLYKNTEILTRYELCIVTELINGVRVHIRWEKNFIKCIPSSRGIHLQNFINELKVVLDEFVKKEHDQEWHTIDLYAENVGGQIKSYTRETYGDTSELWFFDIKINDQVWLDMEKVEYICKSLGIRYIPWAWCWANISKSELNSVYHHIKNGEEVSTELQSIMDFFQHESEVSRKMTGNCVEKYGIVLRCPGEECAKSERIIAKFKLAKYDEIVNCPYIGRCWAHRCWTIEQIVDEFVTPMRVEQALFKLLYGWNTKPTINMIQEYIINDIEYEARGEYDLLKIAYDKNLSIAQVTSELRRQVDERVEYLYRLGIQEGMMLEISNSLSNIELDPK